jgi:3-hydroxybutyryl-CoA dehydratase
MIGFLATAMEFQFVASVYIGDTITCTITISEKDEEKRTVKATASYINQEGATVLLASFGGFPADIRLAR